MQIAQSGARAEMRSIGQIIDHAYDRQQAEQAHQVVHRSL